MNIYTEKFSAGWDGYFVIAEVGGELEVGAVLNGDGPATTAEYMVEWCERVARMAMRNAQAGGEGND